MSTIIGLSNNTLTVAGKGHAPNNIFQTGQRIIYEGEEAQIIRLSPLPVVKTGSRVICGALLTKIEHVASGVQETV